MNPVIEVKNVSKSFKVYYDKGSQLKEKVLFWKRNRYEERQILKDINFTVNKGEAVGLIGVNGCGKSTTLKLLSKIIYPDTGEIKTYGRVSSLLELGAGFHPDMSGRENIYTNASIFGLTKKEIEERMDDIIEFSELEDFLDNPVRTYSSGMYMRLAFSVAINVDADILLVDEILAVGDANFQTKCFNRLRELKAAGMTIILVTHDSSTVEKFCDSAIWLNEGSIVKQGKSVEVVDAYTNFMNEKKIEAILKSEEKARLKQEEESKKEETKVVEEVHEIPQEKSLIENTDEDEKLDNTVNEENIEAVIEEPKTEKDLIDYSANRFGLKYIEIKEARMINQDGTVTKVFHGGERIRIEIDYAVNKPLDEYIFGFGIFTMEGTCIFGNNTQIDRIKILYCKNSGTVTVEIESLPLLAGRYILNVAIVDKDGTPMDFYRNYCYFDVVSNEKNSGFVQIQHKWRIE